jgi:hypothetical protein
MTGGFPPPPLWGVQKAGPGLKAKKQNPLARLPANSAMEGALAPVS